MPKSSGIGTALFAVLTGAVVLASAQAPYAPESARPRATAGTEVHTGEAGTGETHTGGADTDGTRLATSPSAAIELGRVLATLTARADSVDAVFRPLPLLRPAEEAALRRYPNRAHVARAQRLGISRSAGAAEPDALRASGRLVELEDSTAYWVVRELNRSAALVVPDTRALLVEIGEHFQARLAELGAPPFRFEITSVLRTPEDQAALRRSNPNAARGVSAHEYGTTVDVAYNGFAAPASTHAFDASASALDPHLTAIEGALLERVAGRRSGELKAILGDVLRELQAEGKVLVTLERQQPVYHLTVARPLE